ncbi:MAG: gamma-glutamyl-gamma-aminobutyrate hydrolase family protein, partial [Thermodesulfovibrionales bacterium]
MRPLVGVTCDVGEGKFLLKEAYIEALQKAGFEPCIIPVSSGRGELLERLDGVVLSGGDDLHPSCYGEEVAQGVTLA